MYILGVIGFPVILILAIVILALVVAIPITLISSRAKHKARANTLQEMMSRQPSENDRMEKLDRLNQLRLSGALTQEEFEEQKKKILG